MRVAFLTDVHGNLPALEAVLADARAQGATAVWDGGDAVGYYPWPASCVALLAEACSVAVLGNYDRKVLRTPERRERWLQRKDPLKAAALIWAWENLDPGGRAALGSRPEVVRRELAGREVLVCHGSPLSRSEALGPATAPRRWADLAAAARCAVVLHGHTHAAHARREAGTLFFTPGAVGRAEDGDPRAAYALLTIHDRGLDLVRRRVAYDTGLVATEIRRRGLPEEFAVMVQGGLSLPRARRRLRMGRR